VDESHRIAESHHVGRLGSSHAFLRDRGIDVIISSHAFPAATIGANAGGDTSGSNAFPEACSFFADDTVTGLFKPESDDDRIPPELPSFTMTTMYQAPPLEPTTECVVNVIRGAIQVAIEGRNRNLLERLLRDVYDVIAPGSLHPEPAC
jgi:hypothetical protein